MEPTISIHNPKCGDCGEVLKDHESWYLRTCDKCAENYNEEVEQTEVQEIEDE